MIGHHELRIAVEDGPAHLPDMEAIHIARSTPSSGRVSEPRLGVDIGRVIIEGDGPDTSFVGGSEEEALRAPEIPGAFDALGRLHRDFGGRIWLVSKCGKRVEARTRLWLARRRFFEITGISREHLAFCRTRPEKAPICESLRITCFVDDRWDVLATMAGIVPHRILFGAETAPEGDVIPAATWKDAEASILAASTFTEAERRDTGPERAP
jgi:hypothetical protein